MQHDHAVRTHAAERYLLGEMPADERELYEEHYFSCADCEADLAAAAAFVDNARAVLRDSRTHPRPEAATRRADPWWHKLFAAPPGALVPALGAAVVVLATVVTYQQFSVIPSLREQLIGADAPSAVPNVALRSASRGTAPRLSVTADDRYAVLQADVIAEPRINRYTVVLLNENEVERWRTAIAAPEPGIPATILVPVRELPAGEYALIFLDGEQDGREIVRFGFTLDKP